MSVEMSTKQVFEEIESRLKENPEPIQGMETVYQFELSGDDSGVFQLKLSEGTAGVEEGTPHEADCTIQMDSEDFKEMLLGNLNATAAFMSGKLRVKGDMGKAMKLQSVLGKYQS
ncbi:SCP-2 sterol transfer family protein [Melghirimyces profundicolus]|uniref:SCP-2 sterol transfer family protein n=1 Tax=Melghirimyces profundicolus TaxID=1242148 RepID=A0A2T6BG06_9BACL|nr:SCP2 sterol-binding domain-containing protein [Melghirimyces profundicolus]PTX54994.1 SCP-2 sterol transfer family protein [Melghirimyces profundicolus]